MTTKGVEQVDVSKYILELGYAATSLNLHKHRQTIPRETSLKMTSRNTQISASPPLPPTLPSHRRLIGRFQATSWVEKL